MQGTIHTALHLDRDGAPVAARAAILRPPAQEASVTLDLDELVIFIHSPAQARAIFHAAGHAVILADQVRAERPVSLVHPARARGDYAGF